MAKCSSNLIRIDSDAADSKEKEAQCIENMYNECWQTIDNIIKPIKHISQAIAALELDATDELKPMLRELKDVVMYIDEDWQKALMSTSKDKEGMEQLAELSRSRKWNRYNMLYEKILAQMRKECTI